MKYCFFFFLKLFISFRQDGQACCGTEIHIDLKAEVEFNQKWLHRTFEHISPSSQEADLHDFLYLDESPSVSKYNFFTCVCTFGKEEVIKKYKVKILSSIINHCSVCYV